MIDKPMVNIIPCRSEKDCYLDPEDILMLLEKKGILQTKLNPGACVFNINVYTGNQANMNKFAVHQLGRELIKISHNMCTDYNWADLQKKLDKEDPPEEKEECASGASMFLHELRTMAKSHNILMDRIEKLESRINDPDKVSIIGYGMVEARLKKMEERQDVQCNRINSHDSWKVDIQKENTEIMQRIEGIEKSVIMGCGQDAARMDHLNMKIDVIDKEKCVLSNKLYDTAEEQNKLEKRIETLENKFSVTVKSLVNTSEFHVENLNERMKETKNKIDALNGYVLDLITRVNAIELRIGKDDG